LDNSLFDGLRYFASLGTPALKTRVLIHEGEARYPRYQRENFIDDKNWGQA